MRRFVVTGCARSGLAYTARLLSELGVWCGHEGAFNDTRQQSNWSTPPWGDASFLAAAHVARLKPGTMVLHQLRNPLDWIRSYLRKWPTPGAWRRHGGVLAAHGVEWDDWDPRPLHRTTTLMRLWTHWNAMAQCASVDPNLGYQRHRVEDLEEFMVIETLESFGYPTSRAVVRQAIERIPKDVNTVGDKSYDRIVTVESLPECPEKTEFLHSAAHYGYDALEVKA